MQHKTPNWDASRLGCFDSLRPIAATLTLVLSGCQSLPPEMVADSTITGSGLPSSTISEQQQPAKKLSPTPIIDPQLLAISSQELTIDADLTQAEQKNVFDVIRNGLELPVDDSNTRVRAQLNSYRHNQHHFDRLLERAEPYLYYIVSEVKKRNMPMEFALLPMVESAFDPFAYSFAGAAGLWQFIPSTGRHYGLRQDWWYDGRRDIVASTEAALDYLIYLHDNFRSWKLALAAYNSGFGTVSNAIRRNKRAGKATDFWALSLPRETSVYVPKMLALGAILRDPAKYNLKIAAIPNKPYFEIVDIGQQIDLARAASLAGMSEKELHRLNPGFNRWASSPDGPHQLLIPIDLADNFRSTLAQLPADQRLQLQRYKIVSGDSLSVIAKRFDTKPDIIKRMNRMTSSRIIAGKELLIPGPSPSLADNRSVIRKVNYTVRSGDNLSEIASRYGVRVNDIRSWNTIKNSKTIHPGDNLTLYVDVTQNL